MMIYFIKLTIYFILNSSCAKFHYNLTEHRYLDIPLKLVLPAVRTTLKFGSLPYIDGYDVKRFTILCPIISWHSHIPG